MAEWRSFLHSDLPPSDDPLNHMQIFDVLSASLVHVLHESGESIDRCSWHPSCASLMLIYELVDTDESFEEEHVECQIGIRHFV